MRRFFTIIEDNGVSELLASAVKDDPRIDDIFEALKWRLSREPDCGAIAQHNGIDYRLVFFRPVKAAKNPYILARYQVDEDREEITIDWVKVYPYDDKLAYVNPAFDINA